jgi:tRNA wybutosine-synthesizing protein 1
MDMDERHHWPVLVADWIDRVLFLWHTHRTAVIAVVLSCLFLLRFYLRQITKAKAPSSSSNPTSPLALKDDEKLPWSPEKIEKVELPVPTLGTPTVQRPAGPKLVAGRKPLRGRKTEDKNEVHSQNRVQPIVFYCSLTGTTLQLAQDVISKFNANPPPDGRILATHIYDLSYIDLDDFFITGPKTDPAAAEVRYFYCLLIPSYNIDTIITNFLSHLDETHNDFRIDTAPLSGLLGYSVFGVGDREGWPTEAEGFCSQAIEVDKWMAKLTGRKRAYPLGLGDVKGGLRNSVDEWATGTYNTLHDLSISGSFGEGVPGSGADIESGDEEEEIDFPDSGRQKRQKTKQVTDLEDVRGPSDAPLPIDFTTTFSSSLSPPILKEMVPKTSPTYAALTKQGYTIIGSHSGVKICRWTKSALRGRGSCYKNSFYGIKSHLCMETTPSLSCSNKCVFCWRHGTNPVSTTWRWQVDDPSMIFNGAKEGHYKKIKMLKGVPGVRAERFEEAMRIKHCALSLVGEPIFYPHINEFVGLLHDEGISSFLVCNAQHPDQLASLRRVTQLYVSIDASNRESLRRIDRPLHRDFWERFQKCLDILREKRFMQRTVFRLTLVKGFNVEEEVEGYADLVQKGLPCFVEVKGVTYCGTSSSAGAGLTMQNVPFYGEVVTFVEALDAALARRGLEYGIAAEHAHSCCVLLASKRFYIDGRWNTIIDYGRFFDLLGRGEEFKPEDYCLPTPEWALWGRGGFDPADERVDRKGRPKLVEVVHHAGGAAPTTSVGRTTDMLEV